MCNASITSATIHSLNWDTTASYRSPMLPGSGLGKWGYPYERQSAGLMPSYSWTNIPGGTLRGLTAPSSCTVCLYMLLGRGGKKQRDSSAEAIGRTYPGWIPKKACLPYGWWAIGPPGKKSGTYTMRYIC